MSTKRSERHPPDQIVRKLRAYDVVQPGRDKHQGMLAIGECFHDPRSSPDLFHDPLQHAIAAQTCPVIARKGGNGPWKPKAIMKFKEIKKDKSDDQIISDGYDRLARAKLVSE